MSFFIINSFIKPSLSFGAIKIELLLYIIANLSKDSAGALKGFHVGYIFLIDAILIFHFSKSPLLIITSVSVIVYRKGKTRRTIISNTIIPNTVISEPVIIKGLAEVFNPLYIKTQAVPDNPISNPLIPDYPFFPLLSFFTRF